MMMSRHTTDKFLWMLGGVGLGAGMALLFAPKSGRETRRDIARMAQDGRDRVVETGEEVMDRGKKVYAQGKHAVDDAIEFVDRGRRAVLG
jgi:gas vesicle protein